LLLREKRVEMVEPVGLWGAYVMGLAFAFGWTPCIGPILAGILAVAASQDTIWKGVQLLAIYSLGLGIPFLITALAINQFFTAVARIRRYYHTIEVVSGALLVVIGVLIFTDQFTIIARWLTPYLPTF
jgi:cytochrome c-type biogenesis protein